jgi:hypothetical protein
VPVPRPLRRLFHRPSEIVIGHDERVIAPQALGAVREAWGGEVPVRTMPFGRAEPDPANALMVTLGDMGNVGDGGTVAVRAPTQAACNMLAEALAGATAPP